MPYPHVVFRRMICHWEVSWGCELPLQTFSAARFCLPSVLESPFDRNTPEIHPLTPLISGQKEKKSNISLVLICQSLDLLEQRILKLRSSWTDNTPHIPRVRPLDHSSTSITTGPHPFDCRFRSSLQFSLDLSLSRALPTFFSLPASATSLALTLFPLFLRNVGDTPPCHGN